MNPHIPGKVSDAHETTTTNARPEDSRRRDAAILAAAQNVIAQACRCRVDQAFEALIDAAQHYHLSALQLARGLLQLVGDLSRRPEEFHGPAAVAFQHWGQRLVHTNQLHPETPDNKPRQRGVERHSVWGPQRHCG